MALGASWNARADQPIDDAETLEMLDSSKRDEFLKAIERDSTIADQVIADAAAQSRGGLVSRIGIAPSQAGGESLTIHIEREVNRVLAEQRAQAAIPPGRRVPGIGTTTEGLVYEPAKGGRLAPRFVSVNVAEGTGFRVIRRRGKYLVQTMGGKTVESLDNLALALLLFALLEKKRRDREAKKREEQEAANGG